MEPPDPKTDKDGSQTKAAKQGCELLFPATDRMALRGSRNEGSGGGGSDRMVSGGGPSSKQSPLHAAILIFPPHKIYSIQPQLETFHFDFNGFGLCTGDTGIGCLGFTDN